MVDRVYRNDLPSFRKDLQAMRAEFSKIATATDWVRCRIDPLLRHLEALERILPTLEGAPMRGGVPMLHSDLVYFRQNVRGLKQILASVTKHSHRARKPR